MEVTKKLQKLSLAALMIVDRMLTALRLSSLFTQIMESGRPASARTMLQTAQTVRTPSGRVMFRNTWTRIASGSRLTVSAARLSFCLLFVTSI